MKQVFAASYSTLSPLALAGFITSAYGLHNVQCSFLVRGVGDTYLVTANNSRYILRVYRYGLRTLGQVHAEAELLTALQQHNVPVSYPVADVHNNYVQTFTAPEGERYAILFTYAEGVTVNMPGTPQLQSLGGAMAAFHNVSATIQLSNNRWTFDADTTLNNPLQSIKFAFAHDMESFEWLQQTAGLAQQKLAAFDAAAFSSGYCQFDFLPKNFHFEEDKITLFDFDFFGYGWLANDVMTFWVHLCWEVLFGRITQNDADTAFATFITAYRTVRPLSSTELSALPWLSPGFWIFYLGFYPTHDQFYPLLQPANLKLRVDFIRKMAGRYWNDETAAKLAAL